MSGFNPLSGLESLTGLGKAIAEGIAKNLSASGGRTVSQVGTISSNGPGVGAEDGMVPSPSPDSGSAFASIAPTPSFRSSPPVPQNGGNGYTVAEVHAFGWDPPIPEATSDEIAAVQDRAYRLSLDPANENLLEHLINPATGGSFTDAELAFAIRNGHLRHEIHEGELGATPFNLVQQTNSHNSYVPSLHPPITEQFEVFGLHSFELDINRGDPGYEIPFLGSEERIAGDWYVHHDSSPIDIGFLHATGSETHIPLLSDGLVEVAALDHVAPVTLFVDLKGNAFSAETGHTPEHLDERLLEDLGDKVYTPQHWIDSVPGANTLEEAFLLGGWPTVEELEGRVIVVLTGDDVLEYAGGAENAGSRVAFIAPTPDLRHEWVVPLEGDEVDLGPLEHAPNPAAVFYNTNDGSVIPAIHEGGT